LQYHHKAEEPNRTAQCLTGSTVIIGEYFRNEYPNYSTLTNGMSSNEGEQAYENERAFDTETFRRLFFYGLSNLKN
jgi:hypothetical protein